MKISSCFRVFVPALLLWAAAPAVHAQTNYRIVSIHPFSSHEDIKVGSGWRKDLPQRMQVSLQVPFDTPASSIFVKAYFYDKDDKQVASYPKPNSIWTSTPHGTAEVGLPPTLPRGITNVYFALPEDLQDKKWTTMLVVFGDNKQVAANSLPATALPRLNFPEKAKVIAPPQ